MWAHLDKYLVEVEKQVLEVEVEKRYLEVEIVLGHELHLKTVCILRVKTIVSL